jgi:hypothetical protein
MTCSLAGEDGGAIVLWSLCYVFINTGMAGSA